ncbi:MAG: hypothetical protein QW614_05085 [Candidatus Caldarchaeum sp.]|uniref:EfeO-type cupredoxin-like domain-containing protein n=1 Tax=Caldiarchaeum subterraneum TaxID=311458 RepID=A0A7C5QRY7_CALS0
MNSSGVSKAAVIGVVVVVVAVAALAVFMLVPQGPRTIRLEALEFGFNGPSGGPKITVKAGETLRITLVNKGSADHEFMIVKDMKGLLTRLSEKVKELQSRGLKEEQITTSEEVEEIMDEHVAIKLLVGGKEATEVEVEPGDTLEYSVTFNERGTYYYLCAEFTATFPQTHADKGMYGTIVVEG